MKTIIVPFTDEKTEKLGEVTHLLSGGTWIEYKQPNTSIPLAEPEAIKRGTKIP